MILFGCEEDHIQEEVVQSQRNPELVIPDRSQANERSFQRLLWHFPLVDSAFVFDTDSIFYGMSMVKESPLPKGEWIPEDLNVKWMGEEPTKRNNVHDFIGEGMGGDYYENYPPEHIDALAGFRYISAENDVLVFYTSEIISATNGAFWIVWTAVFNQEHQLLCLEDVAIDGAYDVGGWSEDQEGFHYDLYAYTSESVISFQNQGVTSTIRNVYSEFHEVNDETNVETTEFEKPYLPRTIEIAL